MSTKIVIVGGGVGGASAAAKGRRTNESADIGFIDENRTKVL